MIDYPAARAVAAVAQSGSFEKAAKILNVTPSAVSQRVKHLEERLGVVLIVRGSPCVATEKGQWLCRHIEHVGMLEKELIAQLPGLVAPSSVERVTLNVATNADSLGTWFLKAVAPFTTSTDFLISIAIDDQDHTAEWLQKGRVLAAVTAFGKAVPGCRATPLGKLHYRAVASPDFIARHFPSGVTAAAIAQAPALTFNQKDMLQAQWTRKAFGEAVNYPTHWLPSTHAFVDGTLAGMGWSLNPEQLVSGHLASGRLVELMPGVTLDTALSWQVNRLAADHLSALTNAVVAAAKQELDP